MLLTVDDCATRRAPGYLIRRIYKLATPLIDVRFENENLSFAQWIALVHLRDGTAETAGSLARNLGFTTGATTRLIDSLEARGFVARERIANDRRVVRLALLPEGLAAAATLAPAVVDLWNELLVDFDRAEVETLIALLTKLLRRVEASAPETACAEEFAA